MGGGAQSLATTTTTDDGGDDDDPPTKLRMPHGGGGGAAVGEWVGAEIKCSAQIAFRIFVGPQREGGCRKQCRRPMPKRFPQCSGPAEGGWVFKKYNGIFPREARRPQGGWVQKKPTEFPREFAGGGLGDVKAHDPLILSGIMQG